MKKNPSKDLMKISKIMEDFRKGVLEYRGKRITTRDEAKKVAIKGTNIK